MTLEPPAPGRRRVRGSEHRHVVFLGITQQAPERLRLAQHVLELDHAHGLRIAHGRQRGLHQLVRRRPRGRRHVLEGEPLAAAGNVVPVATLVVVERESHRLSLAGLQGRQEGDRRARDRQAAGVLDLRQRRPCDRGQRGGRDAVDELTAAEVGHGSPPSTPLRFRCPRGDGRLRLTESPMLRPLVVVMLLLVAPSSAVADDALWARLRGGGQVVIMRHTVTTPGVGDPPGFRLDDCATQRNLTETGRETARRIGAAFNARGIPIGRVLSRAWCRRLETARLAFGRAETWPPLANLYGNRAGEADAVRAIREIASRRPESGNLVLVTHGSVVFPVTGITPAPGEFVVLTPSGGESFTIAGRLTPAALP